MIKKIFIIQLFVLIFIKFGMASDINPAISDGSDIPSVLKIKYRKEVTFKCKNMNRFLVMDPKVINVTQSGDALIIKGIAVGQASLLIWTDKRYRIACEVIPPPKETSLQSEKREMKRLEKYSATFQLDYSYSRKTLGESFSDAGEVDTYNQAMLSMRTPFFKETELYLSSFMNTYDNNNDLNFSYGSLSNITWPESQNYSFEFGNLGENIWSGTYTNLGSIKGIRLSPFALRTAFLTNPVNVSIVYGKSYEETGLFSKQQEQYSYLTEDENETLFNLDERQEMVKTQFSYSYPKSAGIFNMNPTLKFDLARNLTSDNMMKAEKNFFDVELKLQNDTNQVIASTGGSLQKTGYNVNYLKRKRDMNLSLERFYMPKGAETVSRASNLTGNTRNSMYVSNSLRDWHMFKRPGWSLYINNDILDREDDFEDEQWAYRLGLRSELYTFPVSWNIRYTDATDTSNPSESETMDYSISKRLKIYIPVSVTLTYTMSETERLQNQYLTSTADGLSGFIQASLLQSLRYSYSFSQIGSETDYSDEIQEMETFGHTLSYSFDLMEKKVNANIAYNYYESESDSNFELAPRNSNINSINISAYTRISNSMNLKLNYLGSKEEFSEDNISGDEYRNTLTASVSSRFHTLFGWRPKTDIEVRSFYDVNANGVFDENIDRFYPELKISINGKYSGSTNDEGYVLFEKVKGFSKIVTINKEDIPEGYVLSTSTKYEFNFFKNTKEKCLFGFVLNTEVSGTVYNDINNNKMYDDRDEALSGIIVKLSNGMMATTDLRGRFYFNPVPEGSIEIFIDAFSVPIGYRSIGQIKRSLNIEKGSIVREYFGFQALRVLKGIVLYKKGNNFIPAENIELVLSNSQKITDDKGFFKFGNISSGESLLVLKINDQSIKDKVKDVEPKPQKMFEQSSNEVIFPMIFSNDSETKDVKIIILLKE